MSFNVWNWIAFELCNYKAKPLFKHWPSHPDFKCSSILVDQEISNFQRLKDAISQVNFEWYNFELIIWYLYTTWRIYTTFSPDTCWSIRRRLNEVLKVSLVPFTRALQEMLAHLKTWKVILARSTSIMQHNCSSKPLMWKATKPHLLVKLNHKLNPLLRFEAEVFVMRLLFNWS